MPATARTTNKEERASQMGGSPSCYKWIGLDGLGWDGSPGGMVVGINPNRKNPKLCVGILSGSSSFSPMRGGGGGE